MSELNKDDLEFLDRIGAWTHRGLKTKILKTQEDSKQWKIYLDGGLNNLFEIVERLKKRIEEIKIDIEESEKNLRNVTVGFKEFEYRHISVLQEKIRELQKRKMSEMVRTIMKVKCPKCNKFHVIKARDIIMIPEGEETFSLEEGKAIANAQWTGEENETS